MAKRGRKPTPTEAKRRRGNPGKRRLPTAEPQPEKVIPFPVAGAAAAGAAVLQSAPRPKARRGKGDTAKATATQWPAPPADLDLDLVALAKWPLVLAELHGMGVLTTADLDLVATYCLRYSRMINARAAILEEGMIQVNKKSKLKSKHPAVIIERECAQDLRLLAAELGLTPSSRTRLTVTRPAVDPFAEFLGHGRR